jgi:acyl carrier protein
MKSRPLERMTVMAVIERETGKIVTPDTLLDSLALDSLEFLDLLCAVESETGANLQHANLQTVGDLMRSGF